MTASLRWLALTLLCLLPAMGAAQAQTTYPSCPKGTIYSLGKCHKPCKPGEEGIGPLCFTDCPQGSTPELATCVKGDLSFDYEVNSWVRTPSMPRCPSGEFSRLGLCWSNCKSGYRSEFPLCTENCRSGYYDTGVACIKKVSSRFWETFTDSYTKGSYTRIGHPPNTCAAGQTYDDLVCYPPCKPGESSLHAVCYSECPPGYYGKAGVCVSVPDVGVRPSYSRGPGVAPLATCQLRSFLRPNRPVEPRPFTMVFAADSQLPWGWFTDVAAAHDEIAEGNEKRYCEAHADEPCPGGKLCRDECTYHEARWCEVHAEDACPVPGVRAKVCTDECTWKESLRVNRWMIEAINKIDTLRWPTRNAAVTRPTGVIMNGDLTSYFHKAELESYLSLWADPNSIKVPVWPGLGNHDYANNINQCTNIDDLHFTDLFDTNSCAGSAMSFVREMVSCNNVANFDADNINGFDLTSGSYSFDAFNYHFVQLNFYPTYAPVLPIPGNGAAAWKPAGSALHWLQRDLDKAAKAGLKIVLNLHDIAHLEPALRDILVGKQVVAVFGGHLHQSWGTGGTWDIDARHKIPVFLSGSPMWNSLMLVEFQPLRVLVSRVSTENGTPVFKDADGPIATIEASCYDWVKNGTETDVDCGGRFCGPCPSTGVEACSRAADCSSGVCTNKLCQPPPAPPPPPPATSLGACVMRDSHTNLPGYNAVAVGIGFAKRNLGAMATLDDVKAQCTDAIFQEMSADYCVKNTDPTQWQVALYDAAGNFSSLTCAGSGCSDHECTVRPDVLGACVMRDSGTAVPGYDNPDYGTGYAKRKLGGVANLDEAKQRCSDELFQGMQVSYCAGNSTETQWQAVTYDSLGVVQSLTCAGSGCDAHACAAPPTPTPAPAPTP